MKVNVSAIVIVLAIALPASARDQSSLGDFSVPASRVPDWFEITDLPLDTSSWNFVDVTNTGQMSAIGCSAANPLDGPSDNTSVNCAISNAANNTVLRFPSGTYNFVGSQQGIKIRRSNIVLRGDGPDSTVFMFEGGTGVYVAGCGQNYIQICGSGASNSTAWTGGYARGSKDLTLASTSGFTTGAWVFIEESDAGDVIDNQQNKKGYLNHISRVESISGNTLRIDRPLRHNFGRPSSSGRIVSVANVLESVGVEDLTLRHRTRPTAGHFPVMFSWTARSWFKNVKLQKWFKTGIALEFSARNLLHGNIFEDFLNVAPGRRLVSLDRGAIENVVENNYFTNVQGEIEMQLGASGNVVAYNYMEPRATGCTTRDIFLHGNYARENLVEGNDTACSLDLDNYWGREGPRNTLFRNRVRSDCPNNDSSGSCAFNGNSPGRIGTHADTGSYPLSEETNFLGNISGDFWSAPGCGNQPPANCFAIERLSTDFWAERNVARGVFGTNQPNSSATLSDNVQNFRSSGAAPNNASWNNFDVPDSLYLSSTPEWWCEEACTFQGETGIGAFGDDLAGSLCRLPAQVLRETGTCSSVGSPPASPPPTVVPPPIFPLP